MKVLERGNMLDGTKIQIEEWHKDYNFIPYGNTIAAYPIAKESNYNSRFGQFRGEKFRAQFEFGDKNQAKRNFDCLANGTKTLKDLMPFMNHQEYSTYF